MSFNLANLVGFLVFSCLEVAYISPSCFVTLSNNCGGEEFFCKFSVFVNKVSYFLGFAFLSSLSSLSSFSHFPGCQTPLLRMKTQEMLG